ncbi:MAG: hypothetical protein ACRDQX_13890 [Pseudonocardiaceae bacterium]
MAIVGLFIVTPGVHPDKGGGYQPDSFTDLLHHEIHLPGLDKSWTHTLIDVTIAADRASAQLTVHSTPHTAVNLDRGLSVVTWQPKAHIRAHGDTGAVLTETTLDAPLHAGQLVTVGGVHYRVAPEITYPHRGEGGCTARGDLDWQHVTLQPDPQPPHQPIKA